MNSILPTCLILASFAPCLSAAEQLPWIRISPDRTHFVRGDSPAPFLIWGVNYDHDDASRLLEDYWLAEWPTVEADFAEIKALGANTVRIHLQLARFMTAPDKPNDAALAQLARLVRLAETTGLYLNITGLACYHKADVPAWYDALDEPARWSAQAAFWQAVARVCAPSPAVFCYDLMNEPILPGRDKKETEWLAGEFGGKHFVQRISLDLAGRTREQVAKAWVDQLTAAIRAVDPHRPITVGVIPWVFVFGGGRPLFHAPPVNENLDFAAVHFYPKSGEIDKALTALKAYDLGKPLVIEEIFPLHCSIEELDQFIKASRPFTDGCIGFYWGRTAQEYRKDNTIKSAIIANWLDYFQSANPTNPNPAEY